MSKSLKELVTNVQVVQFENGRYGIRRGWVCYTYYDFVGPRLNPFWWTARSSSFGDCQTSEFLGIIKILEYWRSKKSRRTERVLSDADVALEMSQRVLSGKSK